MVLVLFIALLLLVSGVGSTVAPTPAPSNIRSASNKIGPFIGTGTSSSTGDGGRASSATIKTGRGIWSDTNNYFYVVEYNGYCVRKFSMTDTIISTFAGTCGSQSTSGDGGPATSGTFHSPVSLVSDTNGKIFITDYAANRIRLVTSGILSTYAGVGGAATVTGDGGPTTSSTFKAAHGIWINSVGDIFSNGYSSYVVRKITASTQIITTIAG